MIIYENSDPYSNENPTIHFINFIYIRLKQERTRITVY